MRGALANKAKERELDAWKQSKIPSPVIAGAQTKEVVDTRWALTWKAAEGKETAMAHPVAKGYQDPDLRDGNVAIAGRVSWRSSYM